MPKLQQWKAFHRLHRDVWQEVDVYGDEGKPDGIHAETEIEAARIVLDYMRENYSNATEHVIRVFRVFEQDPSLSWDTEMLARAEKWAAEEAARKKAGGR